MTELHAFLFGTVRILGEKGVEIRLTRAPEALLAYLILKRHRYHARDALAGIFWPDLSQERARSALNTALWRLRRILEPTERGTFLQTTPSGDVGFNVGSNHWLDVDVFERSVMAMARSRSVAGEAEVNHLEACMPLYRGDLLEGYYHDWALRERERFRLLWLKAMEALMHHHRRNGAHDQALAWGQRILQVEPLQEGVHREMIRIYLESGERALALKHYERCCELMETELGIAPMEETQALYVEIIPQTPVERKTNGSPDGSSGRVHAAMRIVDEALGDLKRARERLRQAQAAVWEDPQSVAVSQPRELESEASEGSP